jgi:hypothetical protein
MNLRNPSFPKNLNPRWNDEINKEYWLYFFGLCLILIPLTLFLRTLPPSEISTSEREEYLRVIYRAPEAIVEESLIPEPSAPIEARIEESTPFRRSGLAERQRMQEESRLSREERKAERLERIRSKGIFTAAGAQLLEYQNDKGSSALALVGGSLEGLVASSISEISLRPDSETIAELRHEGLIKEEIAEIEPGAGFEIKDIELDLSQSEIRLDGLPKVRGRSSADSSRTETAINSFINFEMERLQSCYLSQQKRDKSLKGNLIVRVVILSDGSLKRVRIKNSRWSNPLLGRRVERALIQKIELWQLDPSTNGEITYDFPLIFQ